MMFGVIIGAVGFAFGPENRELALAHSVSDPVKSHVDGLGALLFDGVMGVAGWGCPISSRAIRRGQGTTRLIRLRPHWRVLRA